MLYFRNEMQSTKEKILDAALKLYNQRGVNKATLRDISQEAGISPGNLAYHYPSHDQIVAELFRRMERERAEILMGVQQIPSFENINRQIGPLLTIAWRYRMFHLDAIALARMYPDIAKQQRQYFDHSIKYVKAVIDYSVGSGNMRPEARPSQYLRLAHTVWMLMTFWPQQATLRGAKGLETEALRRHIWDLVIPFLTEKGLKHFQIVALAEPAGR
jgi:AcrR family transcriptional regulator